MNGADRGDTNVSIARLLPTRSRDEDAQMQHRLRVQIPRKSPRRASVLSGKECLAWALCMLCGLPSVRRT